MNPIKRRSPISARVGFSVWVVATVLVGPGEGPADATPRSIEIILDASSSMNDKVGDTQKIAIAKEVLLKLVRKLPANTEVALRAYGHRGLGCTDIELLVPLQKKDTTVLEKNIQDIHPRGKTPIDKALRSALQDFKGPKRSQSTVVLVSDGQESCGGDPCRAVKELRETGIRAQVHVIGFDVNERERRELTCIARAGEGRYYNAKTGTQLWQAVQGVVRKNWMEALMDATTLVITFGLLAFMVERLTNGIAIVLGYWDWWRARMEVPATADPYTRAHIDRNRRVGLFGLSALLGVVGALLAKLNFLPVIGLAEVPAAAGSIVTGLLIASGADPIREVLKLRDRERETPPPTQPIQVTGTLIVQQSPAPKGGQSDDRD